ncbi:hypothetical protein OnM2_020008 [Erysiphe neolycopersici]|uniref:Uncharacterized protein n=1 Tax=Erysiphe neolycopersici TaxID=212602 RepID=A0A420I3L7_9PEZI|nr:hypothetical protein OnM2_020008 [Erysiphe neolycopersici]
MKSPPAAARRFYLDSLLDAPKENPETIEENSGFCPPPDLQQALDSLTRVREPRLLSEGGSSDIEISLSTKYLEHEASSFDSECEGNDQDQDHLIADVEALADSRLLGSDDDIKSNNC